MFILRILIACLAMVCLGTWEGLSFGAEEDNVVSIQFENDFFGGNTDRHFTHGTRIECLTRPIKWISDAAGKVPWFSTDKALNDPKESLKARASLSLGQNIYTPADTTATALIPDDRPYAGWLYVGMGLVANQGSKRYDKLQLEVGIVGPQSYAEDVQTFWHSLLGLYVPKGWDNQLNNELGVVLTYEQARRFERQVLGFGLECDVIPHFGGSLGNVFTYAAAGCIFRLGVGLDEDFGPPRIRPSLPGGAYFSPEKAFGWYLFAGVEGRAVLQNIFLDGNTFSDSHSVDRELFVGDCQAGVAFQWGRFRISYTQILRSKEFEGQDDADVFGSLNFAYHFSFPFMR
jgi:lipid A 3-O-deacylase